MSRLDAICRLSHRKLNHANGFALLPIEAGAIRQAWPFHVSADARKEEDAQPDQMLTRCRLSAK
jgi:hypothetical protein